MLGIYLAQRGVAIATTGVIVGAGLAGASVATGIVSGRGDRFGRRGTLAVLAMLTAFGYAGLATIGSVGGLVALSFVGMLNGMGRDRGAAYALEQALLPEMTDATGRTWVLAWYNVVLDAGLAAGALAAAAPSLLSNSLGVDRLTADRGIFLICAVATMVTIAAYTMLSPRVEVARPIGTAVASVSTISLETKRRVGRLAALFALDSLGSGFLSSALVAYWFLHRYGLPESQIAVLFFVARLLNAASHVMAAWLARRIGLVNTMVATHLPSSLFLMAAPLAPSPILAGALFLAREALVEMDVPTRQSYVMAIVEPHERTFASGITNVTRTVMWAVAPPVAGLVMRNVMAAPLFIGGTLKIAYDVLLYRSFRRLKAPEESGGALTR